VFIRSSPGGVPFCLDPAREDVPTQANRRPPVPLDMNPSFYSRVLDSLPRVFVIACAAVAVLLAAAGAGHAFVDKTSALGVGVQADYTGQESWGHGCGFVDLNNDGVLELYVVMDTGQPNLLFDYQTQSGQYLDIAGAAGCADGSNGRGIVWADYDNDGDQDFFVANFESPCRLYQNDGFGNFANVAAAAGVNKTDKCHSAAWGDYDNDGKLDLFVCVYARAQDNRPNLLFHNLGSGTFEEVAATAGVADANKPALACTWIDYDSDGDIDLFIAYDKLTGNTLYQNNGGIFDDVTSDALVDGGVNNPDRIEIDPFTGDKSLPMNAMGIAVGDYDRNGHLDMFITNTEEGHAFLKNLGNGTFREVASALGMSANRIGWGTAFLDYDNDGDEDLYVVHQGTVPDLQTENILYRNNGNASFTEVTTALGVGDRGAGYGLTVGDYNDDGFVDMFVHNQRTLVSDSASVLYENVPNSNNWVKIRPVGVASNRDGLGAVIRLTIGGGTQTKDVRSGSSYLSNISRDVEFGLGSANLINEIEITWPSGAVDSWTDVVVNKFFVATEGTSLHVLPVFITRFEGDARDGGIELRWTVRSDEAIRGYRVYRRGLSEARERIVRLVAANAVSYLDRAVEPGTSYEYTLGVVEADGKETRSQSIELRARHFGLSLQQNFPNPFNPTTNIHFTLPARTGVRLAVYDVGGQLVSILVDEPRAAGPHSATWNGTNAAGEPVASGIYFYRLETRRETLTRKMILLK
jgi:hypothetical protein